MVNLWSWSGSSQNNESNKVLEEPELVANFDHTHRGDVNDIQVELITHRLHKRTNIEF